MDVLGTPLRNDDAANSRIAREYVALALTSGDVAHWRLDLASRVIRGSRNLADMIGLPASSTARTADPRRPTKLLTHLPRADRQALLHVALAAIERHGRFQHLLPVHTPACNCRWLSIRGQCLSDSHDHPTALVGA